MTQKGLPLLRLQARVRWAAVRACLALVALAILVVPMGRAHLHLCLDGSEPPVSLIFDDGYPHAPKAGLQGTFHDVDVSLPAEALAKKSGSTFDAPEFIAATAVLCRMPRTAPIDLRCERDSPITPILAFAVLPPLRAPPV